MPPNSPYNTVVPPPPMASPVPQPPNGQQPLPPTVASRPKRKRSVKMILLIFFLVLIIIGLTIFGSWAFYQMKDYKLNADKKIETAIVAANQQQKTQLEEDFAKREKEPLKSYTTIQEYGSVKIVYPKTWSAYITELSSGGLPVDGYFYPDYVPGVSSTKKANYSLRIQIVSTTYKAELATHNSRITQGKAKAVPYRPEQVSSAEVGTRIDGQISSNKTGAMIIVPLRDKVLKLWTENDANISDFNDFVLKNLTYSP